MPDSPAFSIEGSILVSFHVIDGDCICIKDYIHMGEKRERFFARVYYMDMRV